MENKAGQDMSGNIKNELRNEKEKLSRMNFGQKLQYIFDYYKFYIIGAVVAVVLISSVISTFLNNKPLAFYAMFLNAIGTDVSVSEEELESGFTAFAEVTDGSEKVVIDTTASFNPNVNSQFSMAQNAKITALFSSHDLDAMVIDPGVFTYYALNGAFTDLREVLSESEFEKYKSENKIYYIDGALQQKLKSMDSVQAESAMAMESGSGDKTAEASSNETLGEMEQFAADLMGTPDVVSKEDFKVPDPEKMETPIPVGIILTDAVKLENGGFFKRTVPIFGIPVVSERKETAVEFLHFMEIS